MDFDKLVLASVYLQYVYLEVRSLDMRFQEKRPSSKKARKTNSTWISHIWQRVCVTQCAYLLYVGLQCCSSRFWFPSAAPMIFRPNQLNRALWQWNGKIRLSSTLTVVPFLILSTLTGWYLVPRVCTRLFGNRFLSSITQRGKSIPGWAKVLSPTIIWIYGHSTSATTFAGRMDKHLMLMILFYPQSSAERRFAVA